MGRFFPHADLTDIIRNMKAPDNASYNATFTYPEGGAIEYVKALASEVRPERDRARGAAGRDRPRRARSPRTTKREIQFERLVSSAPFNRAGSRWPGSPHDAAVFTWNKVLVFNLGFDRKGPRGRPLDLLPGSGALASIASASTTTSSTPTG